MNTKNICLEEAYKKQSLIYRLAESKIGCIVALILVPAGISLDFYVYPEKFEKFFMFRLICDAFIAVIYVLHFSSQARKFIKVLTFSWLVAIQIMISAMIYDGGGYESTYYAGLNLAVLAVGILLPTSVFESVLFLIVTIFLYLFACMSLQPDSIQFEVLYNNLYFLLLTGVISVSAVYFNSRRRFKEFSLSYELDIRNKELAELDHQKNLFYANISHELRTPLTLILAPVQDLLEGNYSLTDKVRDMLLVARNNSLRLLKLVNDLLDVIRLEEGKLKLNPGPLDLTELLNGLLESMSHLSRQKELKINNKLSAKPMVVNGDYSALEKIFMNIMGNAIKFTDAGGTIELSGSQKDEWVVVEIKDDGIGIPTEELPFVFDQFRQVDGSATRKYQGTGLGLALVKELTELQAGMVEIESDFGKGTTLRVLLPASHEKPVEQARDEIQDARKPTAVPSILGDAVAASGQVEEKIIESTEVADTNNSTLPTILIVDDEPEMLHYLVNIMSDDYQILQAIDGRQGLERAQYDLPDLILLDMMLPEINGLEVCLQLKENSATSHIKIVLLTARADESSKMTALRNGADDFLTKPFSTVEVKVRVNNLLRTASLQTDLRKRNQDLQGTLQNLKETQSRLIQSEKLNALGTLSAGLLHEMNNPLNYSMTAIQLALNEPVVKKDEFLLEAMQDIDEGMHRIKSIVTDLRAFAYPSEMTSMERFNFSHALQKALRYIQHELKAINVVVELDKDIYVRCSESHIVQVLVNLLINATKAIEAVSDMHKGEIYINGVVEQDRFFIKVKDNGGGMSQEIVDRIFEPFFTTKDVGQGMGLGLSICHTIINNFGGELSVDSVEGEGCEFTFDLPLATDA